MNFFSAELYVTIILPLFFYAGSWAVIGNCFVEVKLVAITIF